MYDNYLECYEKCKHRIDQAGVVDDFRAFLLAFLAFFVSIVPGAGELCSELPSGKFKRVPGLGVPEGESTASRVRFLLRFALVC
jgi:hypothetical protein